ncbi:protein of unknown function [Magnetospirillum sp. XM-1]|nr:protein of unknown function [Magnetospirillum sp. XM-1]
MLKERINRTAYCQQCYLKIFNTFIKRARKRHNVTINRMINYSIENYPHKGQ